jgi:adenylyltransferase/sulfurtransferase
VLGVLAGVIGILQATEAVKFLLQRGQLFTDALLTYNALDARFRKVALKRNPVCPLCGADPTITELREGEQAACDWKKRGTAERTPAGVSDESDR